MLRQLEGIIYISHVKHRHIQGTQQNVLFIQNQQTITLEQCVKFVQSYQ